MSFSTAYYAGRMAEFVTNQITCDLNLVPLAEWGDYSGRTHRFGWLEPDIYDDRVTLHFCPEVIAEQMREYTEETILQYLMLMEYIIARHVVRWEMEDDERWNAVESDVYEMRPDALKFLSDVQMDILEREA